MTALSLRPVRADDYDEIERLKHQHGLGAYTREEWSHLFEHNPLLRKRHIDWPWGWVLESPDGTVHGHLGNVPVEYSFHGRTIAAAAASDWVVEQDHRGQSLQLVLQFFRQSAAELLLNTTASENYGRAYEKLGARRPPGDYDRNVMWPVNRRAFAAAAIRKLGLPSNAVIRELLAAGLVPVTAFRRVAAAIGRTGAPLVDVCHTFDTRFDAHWERLRSREGLVCVRDAEALRWRFGRGVASGDVWVHAIADGGSVSAYVILAKAAAGGVTRVRLIDYQDTATHHSRVAALFTSVFERCRDESIDAVQAAGVAPENRRWLVTLGGLVRRMPPMMFYFKAVEPELQAALEQPGGWMPGPFDGDGHCGTPAFFGVGE
jgi:hypothetical protein